MKRILLIAIPLVLLAVGFGLKTARKDQVPMSAKTFVQPASAPAMADQEKPQSLGYFGGKNESAVERKIIQSGAVTIEVKRYEPFIQAVEKRIASLNGYVSNVQSQRSGELVSSASLTLRVSPEKLSTLVSWLREQGRLTSEQIQADDISEQYYDLKARLENGRRFEARLLDMLKSQTGQLQDLILVEEKLNQIREQIEQMEGKIRYFDALASLATLTVQVQVESVYVAPHKLGFGERILHAWKDSTMAMLHTAQGLAVVSIVVLPWILPLAVIFLMLRAGYRHIKRRSQKMAQAA